MEPHTRNCLLAGKRRLGIRPPICALLVIALLLGTAASLALAHTNPLGLIEIEWPMPGFSRTLSGGYPDSLGLFAFPRRVLPRLVEVDGRRCVEASFIALDVDDDLAFDIDETVELELLFDSTASGTVTLSYDRSARSASTLRLARPEAGGGRWRREVLTLERARFANRGMAGTDLALSAAGANRRRETDEPNTLSLCSATLRRSNTTPEPGASGHVQLSLIDAATGAATAARLGLYDATGRMPLPSDDALIVDFYDDQVRQIFLRGDTFGLSQPWPSDNRHVFYADGQYQAEVPAGLYDLVASKGPEYRIVQRSLKVEAGRELEVDVAIPRWDDMGARDWYSGDAHIHIERDAESDNDRISAYLRAEDVHVANTLQMHNPGATHFPQYAWGIDGQHRVGDHLVVPGIEGPRTAQRGHTISLNILEPVHRRDRYFLYHEAFQEYARQGGLSGYAHVGQEEFNGSSGLALDVPFGLVDFVEVLQGGSLYTELWYEFLNLGYQITPLAGSDFPYYDQAGAVRSYAKVEGDFTTQTWFGALEAGRTFVTNGPMLSFEVDGHEMGSTVRAARGDRVRVTATARINPDLDDLDRLELVAHGEVVAMVSEVEADGSLSLSHELVASQGVWLAVRASGKAQAIAHSAPVYLYVDGSGSWSAAKAPALIDTMRVRLSRLVDSPVVPVHELEFWEIGADFEALWERQRPRIRERAAEANRRYDDRLRAIRAQR
ncbi:MAG TPA: CehA/McbA family metallohydrolase [Acidobacteriota bacterium]|nr:CehA/McbA family metallohydrolase [Acidobacteriota bacterium]